MATPNRNIVEGIIHGITGYTFHGCRCKVCTRANTKQSREYRGRKFAGNPLCAKPKCPRVASRAYGNGLCYLHAREAIEARRKAEAAAQRRRRTRKKVAA